MNFRIPFKKNVYSWAGIKFGERHKCVIKVVNYLYGLSTSVQQWQLMLGDLIQKMGPGQREPIIMYATR